MKKLTQTSDSGFTLVEALVSTAFIAVGVVGLASLMATGADMQRGSGNSSVATSLATFELERLRMLPQPAPTRQDGGSLTSNVAAHFVVRGRTTIRWTIADGPACGAVTWSGTGGVIECSKLVTVRAFTTNDPRSSQATIQGMLWR